MDLNYYNIRRPDLKEKTCPEGTQLCPGNQTIDNQICVKDAQFQCPINMIQVIDKKIESRYSDKEQFFIVPFLSEFSIVFSKKQDTRPLTDFIIGRNPCIYNYELQIGTNEQSHPSELYNDGCSLQGLETHDTRFEQITSDFQITEYQMQESIGVLDQLNDIATIDQFYDSLLDKKDYMLDLFTS